MLPLRNIEAQTKGGEGGLYGDIQDPPDRLLSAGAKEVNSPCGKAGVERKNTLI